MQDKNISQKHYLFFNDCRYVYKKKLCKTCFEHELAYGHYKDLPNRIASYKILQSKAFPSANNPQHDVHKVILIRWFTNVLIKRIMNMVYKFLQ